jgi:putative membrane protein
MGNVISVGQGVPHRLHRQLVRGLFYLPRIFVNLAMVEPDSHAERERLLLMARKLYRFMQPADGARAGLGFGCGWAMASARPRQRLDARQAAAGAGHHRLLRDFEQLANRRSHTWYRVFNEVTVLLFIAIVVLVVVKPF